MPATSVCLLDCADKRVLSSVAMAKQKPKAKGSRKRTDGQNTAQESKPNLFERLYNRKKFDILGKKPKGERKHGQSVHDGVDNVGADAPQAPFLIGKSCCGSTHS